MDEEDNVRGGPCIATADPHVAHNRETPGALLQLPKPLRGADGELAQPSWSSPEVTTAMGNDEGHIFACSALYEMPSMCQYVNSRFRSTVLGMVL